MTNVRLGLRESLLKVRRPVPASWGKALSGTAAAGRDQDVSRQRKALSHQQNYCLLHLAAFKCQRAFNKGPLQALKAARISQDEKEDPLMH